MALAGDKPNLSRRSTAAELEVTDEFQTPRKSRPGPEVVRGPARGE